MGIPIIEAWAPVKLRTAGKSNQRLQQVNPRHSVADVAVEQVNPRHSYCKPYIAHHHPLSTATAMNSNYNWQKT